MWLEQSTAAVGALLLVLVLVVCYLIVKQFPSRRKAGYRSNISTYASYGCNNPNAWRYTGMLPIIDTPGWLRV
jgi:hypothetical protein